MAVAIPLLSIPLGTTAPVLVFGALSAMVGVFLADDAFVKAGQSVPLS